MEEELRPSFSSAKAETRYLSIHRGLTRFIADNGYPNDEGVLGDPDVIEAFLSVGIPRARSSTRGTYRSVLGGVVKGQGSIGYRGSLAAPRYSPGEVTELISIGRSQSMKAKRSSSLAMLALGIGAGLSVSELSGTRFRDLSISAHRVTVAATGVRVRVVPVTSPFDEILAGLDIDPDEFLFRAGPARRNYKNFVTGFASSLVAAPNAVRFSMPRARATFVCHHLQSGTSLGELLVISGIKEVESLGRYCHQVPGAPKSKSALRRALAGERI